MTRLSTVGRVARALLLMCSLVLLGGVASPVSSGSRTPAAARNAQKKEPLSFAKDIDPILAKLCHQCHTAALKTKGALDMTTYKTFMKGGQSGSPVEAGKSAASLVYKLICRDEKPFMPPTTEEPITIEQILVIKDWIDQGAKP